MSKIMGISRLRTGTDGQGITTLVTFYKCPLKCKYCINERCHSDETAYADYSPEELLDIVKIDDIYFRMSGGGITFGGGEPLFKYNFLKKFAAIAPDEWEIRVETSLNVKWEAVEPLIPLVDQWIIDVKDLNDKIYTKYTGKSNRRMRENLKKLAERISGDKLYLRFPNIPFYNTSHDVEKSLKLVEGIDCKKEVFDYVFLERIR